MNLIVFNWIKDVHNEISSWIKEKLNDFSIVMGFLLIIFNILFWGTLISFVFLGILNWKLGVIILGTIGLIQLSYYVGEKNKVIGSVN